MHNVNCQVVVRTADGMLVVAKRSNQVRVYKLTWTVSFEEQLDRDEDQAATDTTALFRCVIRGFEQELGVESTAVKEVRLLSCLLEIGGNYSASFVFLGETSLTSVEVGHRWATKSKDRPEALALCFVPITESSLTDLLCGVEFPWRNYAYVARVTDDEIDAVRLWHPTSRMRLYSYGRYQRYSVPEPLYC